MSEIIKCLRIGNLLVIPTRGVIAGADGIHRVSSTNIRVLMALVSQRGDSVSHSDLCEMAECDREDLPQHLESLKQALGDTGSQARFVVVNDNHVNLIAPVHDGAGQHQNLLREVLELDNQLTFFQQLLRRKVIRVGAAYIVLAWVVIQVADTVLPRLGFPSWAITLTIAIAMLGFPLAVGIAWLFEATSFGKLREESNRPAPLTGRQKLVDLTAIVSVAAIIGYVAVGVIADVRKAKNREDLSIATSSSIPAANTIAVLPFTQLGGLADQTYIGDGIAEEVLRLLSRLKELNVAARAASFYYKGKDVDIQSMATRLKVRHLLTGSVQVIGNAIRINAEVVDTSTGYQVWSESFDREMDDVFAIQTEIARAVADGSQVVLSEESESELDFRPTNNLEAYDYYLRGRDYLNQPRTVDTLRDARRLFHRALALDPDYALALSGLCETHLGLFIRTKSVASVDDAESTCRAALEIDPSLLEVHTALGNLYWNSGNYEQAEDEFRWAIQQNPRFYQAYAGLGDTLYSQKQLEESLLAYQQLVELQPAYWHGYQRLGAYYYRQGNDQEALRYFQQVTDLSPDNAPGWNNLGAVNYMLGNLESAATAWQRSLGYCSSPKYLCQFGHHVLLPRPLRRRH